MFCHIKPNYEFILLRKNYFVKLLVVLLLSIFLSQGQNKEYKLNKIINFIGIKSLYILLKVYSYF